MRSSAHARASTSSRPTEGRPARARTRSATTRLAPGPFAERPHRRRPTGDLGPTDSDRRGHRRGSSASRRRARSRRPARPGRSRDRSSGRRAPGPRGVQIRGSTLATPCDPAMSTNRWIARPSLSEVNLMTWRRSSRPPAALDPGIGESARHEGRSAAAIRRRQIGAHRYPGRVRASRPVRLAAEVAGQVPAAEEPAFERAPRRRDSLPFRFAGSCRSQLCRDRSRLRVANPRSDQVLQGLVLRPQAMRIRIVRTGLPVRLADAVEARPVRLVGADSILQPAVVAGFLFQATRTE